jgi:hypothetical protein
MFLDEREYFYNISYCYPRLSIFIRVYLCSGVPLAPIIGGAGKPCPYQTILLKVFNFQLLSPQSSALKFPLCSSVSSVVQNLLPANSGAVGAGVGPTH